jgi:hypothetical protein
LRPGVEKALREDKVPTDFAKKNMEDDRTEAKQVMNTRLQSRYHGSAGAKLRTPLQIQLHPTLSLEAGYRTGDWPIPVEAVKSVFIPPD